MAKLLHLLVATIFGLGVAVATEAPQQSAPVVPQTTSVAITIQTPYMDHRPLLSSYMALPDEPADYSTVTAIQTLIVERARSYDVDSILALAIADCEAGFKNVCNRNSCVYGRGVYQFILSTWNNYCEGDIMEAEDNVECAMELLSEGATRHWGTKYTSAPLCRGDDCWGSWACWNWAL